MQRLFNYADLANVPLTCRDYREKSLIGRIVREKKTKGDSNVGKQVAVRTSRVAQQAFLRMSAFSTLIIGPRLHRCNAQPTGAGSAPDGEAARKKGTGCHNLASHGGQEQQLQTQTHRKQARAPTPAPAHMDARGEKTRRFRTPARHCNHGCSRAGGKRVYPTHSTPVWVCNPTSAEAVVWIPACCQLEWKRAGSRMFLSVFLTFCFLLSPPAVILLSSRVLLRCSVSVTTE